MPAKSFRTKSNIQRAWNWIKSNPDRVLKDGYGMRNAYHNFTIVEGAFLSSLFSDLRTDTYSPSTSCKIFLPKASGGLRPYTLLTVRDQVVFQALMNIVAEQLYPKVKAGYYTKTFGHLYAGEDSPWFYKKWSEGYRKFNNTARTAFSDGKNFMASFDLVACYDSIDHKVLRYYLNQIGVPKDATELISKCLSVWTSTDHEERIYQGHGIPQGPMGSGLLSEVVLMAFDSEKRTHGVTYIRYVDDIWFFAKNEEDLRVELVRMDKICKKIGLFPQSSKINIRQVKDIETELKSVSSVGEDFDEDGKVDYFSVLKSVTPSYRITDISKFRYSSARAKADSLLVNRLWRIFKNHPTTYSQLCTAIMRRGKLSDVCKKNIKVLLERRNPYADIHASFIEVLCKLDLNPEDAQVFSSIVKGRFGTGQILRNSDARLSAVVFEFLYKNKRLTDGQKKFICRSPFWYSRREIARFLSNEDSLLIKSFLADEMPDVQISAAESIVDHDIQIPRDSLRSLPDAYFKNFGLKTSGSAEPCKINLMLAEILNRKVRIDWKSLLGRHYKQALMVLVQCRASTTTNIGAWICELDVFNEMVVRSLFERNTGSSLVGTYGSVINQNQSGSPFAITHPAIFRACVAIHERRVSTPTAHAYGVKSKLPTVTFKYQEVSKYKKKQNQIINSLASIYPEI